MIGVSVAAGELISGQRSSLPITFTNTGRGTCSDVVFKLALPAGIVLMAGSDRVEIPTIPAGRTYTHEVTVKAGRPGRFQLTSTNFSYRDEFDVPVRVTDFHASLVVTPAPPPAPVRPIGRLSVECESDELDLGAWDELRILVTNHTGVSLSDVTVAVEGPFTGDGRRYGVAVLDAGAGARCPFKVNAEQGGRHVPVTVHTTYRYVDGNGVAQTRTQTDSVNVVVRPAAPDQEAAPAAQTVLFLAASPQDQDLLRSDLEWREIRDRLQRAKQPDRYRIVEPYFAARFIDISQALIDHEPQVIHFSGHGGKDGSLLTEDQNGNTDYITPEGLAELFGLHQSTARCVILNACYSARLADAMAAKIDYVIGMRYPIGDEAAIEFSVGFYLALFAGWSVPRAFERSRASLLARPRFQQEHLIPLLFSRDSSGS